MAVTESAVGGGVEAFTAALPAGAVLTSVDALAAGSGWEDRSLTGRRRRLTGDCGAYAAWLYERDARVRLTRADLYSNSDDANARVVAFGGGRQAVVEATGLCARENVLRLIAPPRS